MRKRKSRDAKNALRFCDGCGVDDRARRAQETFEQLRLATLRRAAWRLPT